MERERNRRFDDHRGRESYRPTVPRGYSRHTSPARTRSPRLVADTWVPPSSRPYSRFRDRSPLPYRCRSRSPSFRHRDIENGSYSHTGQRKLSPRRDVRPRSPQFGWRPRSPYRDNRSRDVSRGQSTPSWRDPTPPRQDIRLSKRERCPPPAPDHYKKSVSPMRRSFSRNSNSHPSIVHHLRTPPQGPLERHSENTTCHTRRSPSNKDASALHISAPSTVSNSRRSSPMIDKLNANIESSSGRSPVEYNIPQRRASRSSNHSTPCHTQSDVENEQEGHNKLVGYSTIPEQSATLPLDGTSERHAGHQNEPDRELNGASPNLASNQSKSQFNQTQFKPEILSSTELKSSHARGPLPSILLAPTRPRGDLNVKENIRPGVSSRRGPTSISNTPPTGPRSSHVPFGPGDSHRQHIHRHNSVTGVSWPRLQKHANYLASLCTIIPGGRPFSSDLDIAVEKRLVQLDSDRDRLFEQIADSQRLKRLISQEWDKLDRESSICVLKSELAEGHLQRITDGESMHAGTIF